MSEQAGRGRIICLGLGPGDPELVSLRAHRHLVSARQIAYFRKKGRPGHARRTVSGFLPWDVAEFPMDYPATTEIPSDCSEYRQQMKMFYDHWADRLVELTANEDVHVLCIGDPFFYGSFMHLYWRLHSRAQVEIVPGITGMSGCWSAAGRPVTWGDQTLSICTATLPESLIAERCRNSDALVVMKVGRNLPKVKAALEQAGRLEDAWLVECATLPEERVSRLVRHEGTTPYFSIVVVPGCNDTQGGKRYSA